MQDQFIPNSTEIFDESGSRRRLVSIIVPAYNEQDNIERLEEELRDATDALPYDFEFILIDNDSTDNTGNLVKSICWRDRRWKYIKFSRNFHVEASIAAGYRFAQGDAMIVLYSDLQEPPSMIPIFLKKWSEGYDIVYGVHSKRLGESSFFSLIVKMAYRTVNWCSGNRIPADSGDFRLISKRVRDALNQCGDYHRYTRGLIAWLGFPQIGVPYQRRQRTKGKSNSDFSVYWTYFSNAITSFSLVPLRAFSLLGCIIFLLSSLLLITSICLALAQHNETFPIFLTGLVLLLGAIQFLGIGLLGEYVGRTYTEVKHRPLFIVEETVNIVDSKQISLQDDVHLASR